MQDLGIYLVPFLLLFYIKIFKKHKKAPEDTYKVYKSNKELDFVLTKHSYIRLCKMLILAVINYYDLNHNLLSSNNGSTYIW